MPKSTKVTCPVCHSTEVREQAFDDCECRACRFVGSRLLFVKPLEAAAAFKLLDQIMSVLYYDTDKGGWDPNKEWNPDMLDEISSLLANKRLVPVGRKED
jgi:hypothetical protein